MTSLYRTLGTLPLVKRERKARKENQILFNVVCLSLSTEEGPQDAEIFTLVQLSENKVALKSGYGRYLGVNSSGEVIGKAEAVAAREQWEAIFEDVQLHVHVHVSLTL